jgi:sodium/hydrogen exchanger 8
MDGIQRTSTADLPYDAGDVDHHHHKQPVPFVPPLMHNKSGMMSSTANMLACVSGVLLISLLVSEVQKRAKPRWITETGALILTGAAVNSVYWLFSGSAAAVATNQSVHDAIYYCLLPPIIFEAGFTMRKRGFLDNFGAILMLALAGTLLTTIVCGGSVAALSRSGALSVPLSFSESMARTARSDPHTTACQRRTRTQ